MEMLPYGKMVATFVDTVTGNALRLREHPPTKSGFLFPVKNDLALGGSSALAPVL